jgi:hypothetical protein
MTSSRNVGDDAAFTFPGASCQGTNGWTSETSSEIAATAGNRVREPSFLRDPLDGRPKPPAMTILAPEPPLFWKSRSVSFHAYPYLTFFYKGVFST